MVTVHKGSTECLVLETDGLRLVFRWTGDRWQHHLEARPGPASGGLAWSLESGEAAVSPTYQDLRVEPGVDHATVMALGKYGRAHYAATFRVDERENGNGRESWVEVDIALRGPGADTSMAATYTVQVPPVGLSWRADSGVCWTADSATDRVLVLERHPDDAQSTRICVDEAGRNACRAQVLAPPSPERSRRLRYRWIFTHSGQTACSLRTGSRTE